MINTLKHRAALVTAIFMVVTPALSQAPSEAQREAIKSECRSDYMAHCSSIPPGGEASLQCLQKNMSSLSGGCAGAVRAVAAPAAPKAESAPAAAPKAGATTPAAAPAAATAKPATETAAPKSAAGTAAKQPTSAQTSAIRSACRSDYPKVCAGVPTGGAPALQCLEKNKAKVSAACQQAVNAVSGGAAPATPLPLRPRRRCRGGSACRRASPAGAAADAAARGAVRVAVGVQRRCSHAVRRRGARRRPHHAMPCGAGRHDFTGVQGRAGPVRGAVRGAGVRS